MPVGRPLPIETRGGIILSEDLSTRIQTILANKADAVAAANALFWRSVRIGYIWVRHSHFLPHRCTRPQCRAIMYLVGLGIAQIKDRYTQPTMEDSKKIFAFCPNPKCNEIHQFGPQSQQSGSLPSKQTIPPSP